MIELVTKLKLRHDLKVVVISNESREVNAYRIRTFKLDRIIDTFISSCFVHLRKPDAAIFRLAMDIHSDICSDRGALRHSKHSSY